MSEPTRNGKPRKILGSNGSSTGLLYSSNTTLNLNSQQQQNPACSYTNGESAKYSNLTFTNAAFKTIPLQQQQMDRVRLPLMSQDIHAIWPYGPTTILSPMMPAHALPYALAGTLPYAAVPIYQSIPSGPQQCTSSPVSNSSSASSSAASQHNQIQQQRSIPCTGTGASGGNSSTTNQNPANDSNKINIQIGLQCVSQNSPLNFNSMHDSGAKVNLVNFCNPPCHMGEKDCKDLTSSLRNSPILLTPEDSAAGGDATNLNYTAANGILTNGAGGATIVLSQAKFNELTRLALRGSEIAEKLAYTHRNRPCFKKIDSLCARMKQDLIRPDGVLPNINSQGIAWAVKDFIFVFTRVINAWIIIKGYVYNTPEGLNKVKAALSPDFNASFAAWQDTTMDFIESLIKSFVNLDNLVQSQKNVYHKSDLTSVRNNNSTPIKILPTMNTLLDDSFDFLNNSCEKSQPNSVNKNYIFTMVEDSEGSQRQATVNGTYFKTGTYNPIKKDSLVSEQIPNVAVNGVIKAGSTVSNIVTAEATTSHLLATAPLEQYFDDQLSGYWPQSTEIDPNVVGVVPTATAAPIAEYLKPKEKIPTNWLNYDLRVLVENLTEFSKGYDPTGPPKPLGKDLIDKLNIMIERLMSMSNADMFFKQQFTNNYFPDFMTQHKHEFMDIRSIIMKCQLGGYQSIFEMVHDIRKIIYSGKEFLKNLKIPKKKKWMTVKISLLQNHTGEISVIRKKAFDFPNGIRAHIFTTNR